MLPTCPDQLPTEILEAAETMSLAYAQSPVRPRLDPGVVRHWDGLIDAWSEDPGLPLFIRKDRGKRGTGVEHPEGRLLVRVDNSPAHWALAMAFGEGQSLALEKVRQILASIPVAIVMTKAERSAARFKVTLPKSQNVNTYGWKLDHIYEVGLNDRKEIGSIQIEALKRHFRLLMKPSNMVLVPTALKGLGDLPMFLDILKRRP